jgi:hypothetical protein
VSTPSYDHWLSAQLSIRLLGTKFLRFKPALANAVFDPVLPDVDGEGVDGRVHSVFPYSGKTVRAVLTWAVTAVTEPGEPPNSSFNTYHASEIYPDSDRDT